MAARTKIPITPMSRFSVISSTSPAKVNADTVNGNLSDNDGYTYLELTLTGGVARTVTVIPVGNVDQNLTSPNRVITLPSNDVYVTGVFPMEAYGAQLLYTASGAGVAVRAISLRGAV